MKKIHYFSFAAAAASILLLASCRNVESSVPDSQDGALNPLARTIDTAYLSEQGYMGGSVFYNPQEPQKGHLVKDAVIAFRLGKLEKKIVEVSEVYSDVEAKAILGYLQVSEVNKEKISFAAVLFDAENKASQKKDYTLALGQKADLNSDGIDDVLYALPAVKKEAFKDAVHLSFLSERETLSTAMFAVLTEQYAGNTYPSSVIGINNNGKFLYSKYQDAAGTNRAALSGVTSDDFILDVVNSCYVQLSDVPDSRKVTDKDLDGAKWTALQDAIQLANFQKKMENQKKRVPTQVLKLAKSNTEYTVEHNKIQKEFKEYNQWMEVPVKKYVDKLNEYSNVEAAAEMGLYGKYTLTWNHLECDVMAGAYLEGRIDMTFKKSMEETLTKFEKEFKYESSFSIGPIPVKLECPMSVKIPLKATMSVDTTNVVAKFTGLYGAGVAVGADVYWDRIFSKHGIDASAEPYALSDGIFFLGVENDDALSQGVLTLGLTVEPEVSVQPGILLATALKAGMDGSYKLVAGLQADAYSNYTLKGKAFLKHSGEVQMTGGIKIGFLEKNFSKSLYKFEDKPIVNEEYTVSVRDIAKNLVK